jgi:hypothetical protein
MKVKILKYRALIMALLKAICHFNYYTVKQMTSEALSGSLGAAQCAYKLY